LIGVGRFQQLFHTSTFLALPCPDWTVRTGAYFSANPSTGFGYLGDGVSLLIAVWENISLKWYLM
jgi:hypothetical protein